MSAMMQEQSGVRPVREDDLTRIMEIETAAYVFPWTRGLIKDCIENQDYFYALIEQHQLIGYGVMSCAADEAHILNLAIDPDWQGRGFAKILLRHLMTTAARQQAENLFLEVRVSNLAAQRLYENAGFNQLGMRKGYYPAGNQREDAMLYGKSLVK